MKLVLAFNSVLACTAFRHVKLRDNDSKPIETRKMQETVPEGGLCNTMIPPSPLAPDDSSCWEWYTPPADGVLPPGAPKPPTGCDYAPCEAAVCECDSYCCDTAWDLSCRGYYMKAGDTIENNYFVPGCSAKLLCCEQESAFPDPPIGAAMAGEMENAVQVFPAFAEEVTEFSCEPGSPNCCETMKPPSFLPPDDSTCWQWWEAPADGVMKPDTPAPQKGCNYKPCEAAVCACDSYCCESAWDLSCRGYEGAQGDSSENNYFVDNCSAKILCCEPESAFPDPPVGGATAGEIIETQIDTSFQCDPNAPIAGKFCCETMKPPSFLPPADSNCWDWVPVESSTTVLPPDAQKGCDYSPCEAAVCDCDPYCCNTVWDESCRGYDYTGDEIQNNYFVDGCSSEILCCNNDMTEPTKQLIKEAIVEEVTQKETIVKEVPVPAPKEIVKEIPVPIPVVKEVVKEIPVPQPETIVKQIPVPKPVPVPVQTIKQIPVPVPVQTVKQIPVPVPVPVQTVKQIPVPVPVPQKQVIPVPKPVPVSVQVAQPKIVYNPVPQPKIVYNPVPAQPKVVYKPVTVAAIPPPPPKVVTVSIPVQETKVTTVQSCVCPPMPELSVSATTTYVSNTSVSKTSVSKTSSKGKSGKSGSKSSSKGKSGSKSGSKSSSTSGSKSGSKSSGFYSSSSKGSKSGVSVSSSKCGTSITTTTSGKSGKSGSKASKSYAAYSKGSKSKSSSSKMSTTVSTVDCATTATTTTTITTYGTYTIAGGCQCQCKCPSEGESSPVICSGCPSVSTLTVSGKSGSKMSGSKTSGSKTTVSTSSKSGKSGKAGVKFRLRH